MPNNAFKELIVIFEAASPRCGHYHNMLNAYSAWRKRYATVYAQVTGNESDYIAEVEVQK